uniref:Ig-like domain-containing protein n=1 Tax=Poecilia reticulata TaxID=8081 RepID=A0A3P9QJ51_POERE
MYQRSYCMARLLLQSLTLQLWSHSVWVHEPPPSVSVPQKWVLLEKESQLECHARGFYPPPVFFSWTREEEVIQPALQVEGEPSPDGFYTAVNNLTFYPSKEDQNVTFSCQVSHRGSTKELDFRLSVTRLRLSIKIHSCVDKVSQSIRGHDVYLHCVGLPALLRLFLEEERR